MKEFLAYSFGYSSVKQDFIKDSYITEKGKPISKKP